MGDQLITLIEDENIIFAVRALRCVVVLDRRLSPFGLITLQGLLYHVHRVGHRMRFGGAKFRTGQNLIPAGAEQQPIPLDHPGMLVLLVAGGKVLEEIVHPQSLFGRAEHQVAETIAGDIDAQIFLQVHAKQVRVGVGDQLIVLIEDEDIIFAVRALRCVVVINRRVSALGFITSQGLLYHGHRVGHRMRFGGAQFQTGQNLVPARAEDEAVMTDDPGMFVLMVAGGDIEEEVVDPEAFLVDIVQKFTVTVSGDIDAELANFIAYGILSAQLLAGVADEDVVFVDEEDVPFAVDVCGRVNVFEGGFASLRLVALDGLFHKMDGVA